MIHTLNNEQMKAALEFSTDGIYVVDRYGVTLFVNRAYEQISGFTRELLVGRHMQDLIEEGYINESVSLQVLQQKRKISLLQNINQTKEVIVTGNPVFDEQGNIQMIVTSVRDVTKLNAIQNELSKAKTFSQMQNYRFSFTTNQEENKFLFKSMSMKAIYEKIQQVASFPTSILLTGPSGVGKEVLANLIHHLSDRKDKPFIKVNCGAIPESLLESEFFGYDPGAFTGASREGKIGLLELANEGTIMLDEIGEMPVQLQVKLLRAIQEKSIRRIGGSASISLDIRIISATNQNISALIDQKKFREDLYYRISVIEIPIPSLAQRREDIELLVEHYFEYFCQKFKVQKEISHEAKKCLLEYDWPGNVRELKNVMESMVAAIPHEQIELYHLPNRIQYSIHKPMSNLKQRMEQIEKQIVREAILHHSSLRQTSKYLGIDHSTLIKKLKRWEQP
ncbi:sigma 54-interacting transcriptional regulator [Aneurinibacillus sp. Ricciae_BoGa-3]|uniref:sigma-54 interaction domain-containing protein n=1 Tax=Aneurinibacillus sp. Ricciae_BoGa-3 TaxID=3022697 RepID=UPI0023422DD7|nr:sigma 54-interacting transcriptional regulator [Aneurinibacillus sp. Ricciae_BoGa-3]WCK52603.1 sigma 54-interacting transcriptional regulator [Aneurinibacillus sp. Ricciae_BoGa-3]